MPISTKVQVAFQVAQALRYMHTATPPTIHLDVKPANVLVCLSTYIQSPSHCNNYIHACVCIIYTGWWYIPCISVGFRNSTDFEHHKSDGYEHSPARHTGVPESGTHSGWKRNFNIHWCILLWCFIAWTVWRAASMEEFNTHSNIVQSGS